MIEYYGTVYSDVPMPDEMNGDGGVRNDTEIESGVVGRKPLRGAFECIPGQQSSREHISKYHDANK